MSLNLAQYEFQNTSKLFTVGISAMLGRNVTFVMLLSEHLEKSLTVENRNNFKCIQNLSSKVNELQIMGLLPGKYL